MQTKIQPDQYMSLKSIIYNLIHNYESVNDYRTIDAIQTMAATEIKVLLPFPPEEVAKIIDFVTDIRLRRRAANQFLETIKEQVVPFKEPTPKQVEKVFRKTKKLKVPQFKQLDLRDYTYIGWNDFGTQKKFLLYYDEQEKLSGVVGCVSPTTIKGFCSICHQEANVVMFMALTNKGSEGRYTKKGNYICTDSRQCNQRLYRKESLIEFVNKLK